MGKREREGSIVRERREREENNLLGGSNAGQTGKYSKK